MTKWLKIPFTRNYWKYGFSIKRATVALLGAFGALWLIAEIASFFSQPAEEWLKTHWWLFLVFGVLWAIRDNWPRHVVCHRLAGRDVSVEIRAGDLFDMNCSLVVGSNTTFDTDTSNGLISPTSVQGQFTRRFYDNVAHLDRDIEEQLKELPFDRVSEPRKGKNRRYPIGTVVRVTSRGTSTYLVAISHMNEHGNCHSTYDDLKVGLASLWEHVGSRGTLEPIAMPILGTGYSRITQPRAEIVREIVNSFVAACAASRFCEKLSIVIPVKDFYEHEIDIEELGAYLKHVCTYTQYKNPGDRGAGAPIV